MLKKQVGRLMRLFLFEQKSGWAYFGYSSLYVAQLTSLETSCKIQNDECICETQFPQCGHLVSQGQGHKAMKVDVFLRC